MNWKGFIMWSRVNRERQAGINLQATREQKGFTLWEIMVALVISGVLLAATLPIFTGVWRGYLEDKRRLELQYSLLAAGRTVADAIRTAKTVERLSTGKIKVVYRDNKGQLTTDYYYVDDRDYDGIKDLYREHVVPSPVASWISSFVCDEVEPGLWQIKLVAEWGGQKKDWQGMVKQRTLN